jgi:hypothetical protein
MKVLNESALVIEKAVSPAQAEAYRTPLSKLAF